MTKEGSAISDVQQQPSEGRPASARFPWRYLTTMAVLSAGAIWWSAAPLAGGSQGTRIALIAAIVAAAGGLGQVALASAGSPAYDDSLLASRLAGRIVSLVRTLPWCELMTVAVLALEALHRSRPWHTAVLGAALLGYLLAAHLAETRADASVLRRQLPLAGLGLGLTALAVGFTALPGLPAGVLSSSVRVLAAVVAVVAAGLAVPVWLSRGR